MRILALLAVRNEIRFVDSCLRHLVDHGIETHVIDNGSTDGTVELVETWLGHGVVQLDHQPWVGTFELREQLRLKELIATSSAADWFMHLDADERREPPLPYSTLAEAILDVDRRGYNAIDFDEFVFVPTAEDPDFDGPDFEQRMRWYYHYEPTSPDRYRVNAWKRTTPIDLAGQGGHHVRFPGIRVFPRPFIMRHYPVLGLEHAKQKYGTRVFSDAELGDSWHGDRSGFTVESVSFPARDRLHERPTDPALHRSPNPSPRWGRHPFLDPTAGPVPDDAPADPEYPVRLARLRRYAADNRAHIPSFAAVATTGGLGPAHATATMWSVMVPVRNPRPEQLAEALQSVLDQDPGPHLMQIEVLDDASRNVDEVEAVIDRLGRGRIRFTRHPEALGLAGNWNAAVRRSTGRYVHLLHQDDRVLPGFYDRLGRPLDDDPALVGAFCRVSGINAAGEVTWTPVAEQATVGPVPRLDVREAQSHVMIIAGVVVRRSSYELIGGYRTDMPYCTDWDFLKRLAVLGRVWYEPTVLAHWRQHEDQESVRLAAGGADLADRRRSVELSMAVFPPETAGEIRFGAYRSSLLFGVEALRTHIESGALASARSQTEQLIITLDHLAEHEPWRDATAHRSASPQRGPSMQALTSVERQLAAAERRIEQLEAQLKGWAAAVRIAQSTGSDAAERAR